jgi:hypothetical protein
MSTIVPREESEKNCYAYLIDTEEVVEYYNATSQDFYDTHPECFDENKLIGVGYVCGYDYMGNLWCSENITRFYRL